MRFPYTVVYQGTITNAGGDTDLFEGLPADDKPVSVYKLVYSQTSEVGDSAEEGLRISIIRLPATVTSGSGGSSVTPAVPDSLIPAAGSAWEANNTTVATTSSTAVTLQETGWNLRASPTELVWVFDEEQCTVRQGEAIIVRLQTTPADDFSGVFTLYFKEG